MWTKKLSLVVIGIFFIWLLVVQLDVLSAGSPRFGIRAWEYSTHLKFLADWNGSGILPKPKDIGDSPTMQYNYATMLAQQWEKAGFPEAVEPWKQAISLYDAIDSQELKHYAEHNKNILQQLIDQSEFSESEDTPEQEQWEDSQQAGQQEWEQESDETWNEESGWSDQDDSQSWSQWEPSGESQESWLTEEQIQQIQDYQKQLQQQQFQNQKYFGKKQQYQPQGMFEQFFGQPQFQQNTNGTEKDW